MCRSLPWLFCLLLFTLHAPAATLLPTDASLVVERLDDHEARLDANAALASRDWRPLPGSLSAGFVPGAIWLRLQVQTGTGAPRQWMLMLSNALLDGATLFDARDISHPILSGEAVGRQHWAINYRSPAFALDLDSGQPRVLLLRLESKNAMSVSLRLISAERFAWDLSMEYLGYGLYFGICLVLILFHSAFWRMTQAPESGWYLAYVSFAVLIELLTLGLPQQMLALPMTFSDTLLGCALGLSLPVGVIFTLRQLQASAYPRLQRWLIAASLIIGTTAALTVLAGHYQVGAPLHQVTVLASIGCFIGLALWLMYQGHRPARYFLLLFGLYYLGIGISFLRNLGLLPASFFTDNAVALGALLHMLLMSQRIIRHYRCLKAQTRRAEDAVNALIRSQNARLEEEIDARTRELRQALHQEQRMREEQRDFVAMVSHEFRTPLAIIATSAQQIRRNLMQAPQRNEQRCHNIHQASRRLLCLVDDYLEHDRVAARASEPRCAVHDLDALFEGCLDDFPPGRIELDRRSVRTQLECDFGLLRVALRNLLANADRHAPASSIVLLRVEDGTGGLRIRVTNEGAEIPAEQAPLLFHKYVRGTQAQHTSGTGLGLYLVKRIAELHGGSLVLESRGQQRPICFCLELPQPADSNLRSNASSP
ncbi:histidine kinase [Pseudomonas sp. SDI]|uniref:sensor histidine kinase n=1 Tax=Pseudomonas sp. SDI TaxID=2170734 RepID=UPI000DE5F2BE|nr:sensor histidine kinase [Pseudomonas sp. SDI]PWB35111.1 histidine kinase [Pseudomonas sp. SDI]